MEKDNKEKNSTVAISPETAKRLDRFCRANGITKKDFISLSLRFFEREGINPATHESPKTEMEKIRKRIDQLFSFFVKQEQDIIRPILLETIQRKEEQKNQTSNIISNQVKLSEAIKSHSEKNTENMKFYTSELNKESAKRDREIKHASAVIANLIDPKNRSGKLDNLFG